jgi:hypothetical protein
VHGFDDVWSSDAQHLVTAFKGRPAKVLGAQVKVLDKSAKSPIKDDDSFLDGFEIRLAIHDLTTLLADTRTAPFCYLFHCVKDAV